MSSSGSELSSNDQVVSMEAGETNNAVTQFVGDIIYLNIVYSWQHCLPLNGLNQSHLSGTTFAHVKLKALDKAKILR